MIGSPDGFQTRSLIMPQRLSRTLTPSMASAIADAAQRFGHTFNVIPAGERWPDGSLRPALEDWLGAGAILRWLPGSRSPEAESAVAIFERYRDELVAVLDRCCSGRELDGRGHRDDALIAGALNVSDCVPRFAGLGFVADRL